MFQFHQNNSQLLFHIIVSLWGAGAFSRDFTTNLARRCRAFTRALKNEKLKARPFPGPGGAGDTNDWCINAKLISTFVFATQIYYTKARATCETSQVLLAGVPGVFSQGSPVFGLPTDWPVS